MTSAASEPWGHSFWQKVGTSFVVKFALGRAALALGLSCWLLNRPLTQYERTVLYLYSFLLITFSIGGAFLYRRSASDIRARHLGSVFALMSSVYSQFAFVVSSVVIPKELIPLLAVAAGLRPDMFLAYYFWLLVAEFPSPTALPELRRAIRIGLFVSLVLGVGYFLLGALRIVLRLVQYDFGILINALAIVFIPHWYVLLPILGLAFPVAFLKLRQMRRDELRRASIFFGATGICFAFPLLALAFGINIQGWDSPTGDGTNWKFVVNNLLLSAFPLATTYAVLAHRVLDVQNIARSAVRHMLAKYSVILLALVPFAFLAYFGWVNRESTLAELFSGSQAVVLLSASALGILAMLYRQPLLDLIDRRFFREQYNARRVLTELVEQVRGTRNLVELAKLLERGVNLALHLERVSLLVESPGVGRFVDPLAHLRPLDPGSQLLTLVAGSREPLAVDLEAPTSPFLALPEEEKLWLLEGRIEMIAPAHSLDGVPIGLLVLGPKRSELPFLREDRELIAGVASSAGLVVELLRLKETASPAGVATPAKSGDGEAAEDGAAAATEETALECIACDRVFPPGTPECPNCHVDLEKTSVPYIVRELYRLDQRLGAGGMAVVYRAKDLKLGRPVAVKTLPKVNAEAAMRLRREARTAASVSHPGLAAIYGLETWRGVPLIVTEFLAGGTLADQLGQAPLEALEAIDMAQTIAQALAKIHGVGILHRDVKPSNIGYTEDGAVKLLDFGIARIQHDFRQEKADGGDTAPSPDGRSRIVNTASVMLPRTRTGQLVGTVTYLSPEAARGEKPDPSVDLWALAVCLYEALTAENLFFGRSFQEVLGQIRELEIPDVRKKAPACPEPLALLLAEELSLDRSRRAEDGLELASRLAAVRAKILAGGR